jgi:hypothetical protein
VTGRQDAVVGHAVLPGGRNEGRELLGKFHLAEDEVRRAVGVGLAEVRTSRPSPRRCSRVRARGGRST